MNEPPRKRRSWARLGCVAAVLTPLLLCYAVYLGLNPYNEVKITVTGTPEDTYFLCFVADRPGGPKVMWWSLVKVFPFSMRPGGPNKSLRWFEDKSHLRYAVRWVSSPWIGVL